MSEIDKVVDWCVSRVCVNYAMPNQHHQIPKEYILEAKSDLLRLLLAALPSASMTMKLSAEEKYIWISAVYDCRAALTKSLQ